MARMDERTKKAAVAMPAPHTNIDAIIVLVSGIPSKVLSVAMSQCPLLIWIIGSRKMMVDF